MKLENRKFFDEVRGKLFNQDEIIINEKNEKFLKTTNEKLDEDGVFIYPTNLLDKEGREIWQQDLVEFNDKIFLIEEKYGRKAKSYQMSRFPLTIYKDEKPINITKKNAHEVRRIGSALKFDTVYDFMLADSLDRTFGTRT